MRTHEQAVEQGTRDNRRGQAWQRRCAQFARQWFPGARHVGQYPGAAWESDLSAVGPRVLEATVFPWDKIALKLRQAERAAAKAGLFEFYVWKHIGRSPSETGSEADSVLITRARVMLPLMAELDALRDFASAPARQADYAAFKAAREALEARARIFGPARPRGTGAHNFHPSREAAL